MASKRDLKWWAVEAGLPATAVLGQQERFLDEVVDRLTDEHGLVDPNIRAFEYDGEPEGTIIYPVVQGRGPVRNYMLCALGHAFRTRGYEPVFLLCDGSLDMCMKKRRDGHDDARCAVCEHTGRRLFDAFGFDPVYLSELPGTDHGATVSVDSLSDPFDVTYRGVDIADFAVASTRNHLKMNEIDLSDPEVRALYEGLLDGSAQLVDATVALLDETGASQMVGNHPAYVYGGVPLATASARDVETVTIMGGKRDRTLLVGYFGDETPLPTYTEQAHLDEALSVPLSEQQETQLDEIIAGRRDGSEVRYHYASDSQESVDTEDGFTVGVFSNLMWDASLASKAITFGDPYEWVVETLSALTEHDDTHVVLKPHPAEAMREANRRLDHWLEREHPTLVDHIELLPPDTDVSPYELMSELDAGVVYSTNLALEMAIDGIPAVVAAAVHYRGNGFTIDPPDRATYLETLQNIQRVEVTDEMQARARRYAHLLWVRKHIPFPVYETSSKDDFGSVHALPVSHEDLKPGNEHIDFVVERVLAGEPVVPPVGQRGG